MRYGYIRVSSKDQNEARQIKQMRELGIEEQNIFIDKQSGKDFNREHYQELIGLLREGDIVHVPSIDRLGRNYDEIRTPVKSLSLRVSSNGISKTTMSTFNCFVMIDHCSRISS